MRRSLSVVTSLVLAAGLIASACTTRLTAASPSATASSSAAATCEVTNTGTGTTFAALQEAVDAATSGDTLEVRGTCVGRTIIRMTRLRLKGIATTEQPTPTLDGAQLSRVLLVVSAKVVIRDLTITNGRASRHGGGIFVDRDRGAGAARPRVTLRGDTSVTGNTARSYGGGISGGGTLTLNDSASVTENTARSYGGGISSGGTLILNDSASVTGNTARGSGGGIMNYGTLTLNDSASVTENTADGYGGGIINYGTLTLNDSASVTGNTAEHEGGGIYNEPDYPDRVYVCSDEVAISPNDPDDPPKVRHVCP